MDQHPAGAQIFGLAGRHIRAPFQSVDRRLLVAARATGERPICRCTPAGVPMYVARLGAQFQIKCMPGTGPDHDLHCPSYRPDGDRPATPGAVGWVGYPAAGIHAGPPAPLLTLPNLLDDLWQRARLNSWTPRMAGKRTWRVVSWHLRHAATGRYFRGGLLDQRLFIPEPFTAAHKAEIAARRAAAWAPAAPVDGAHHVMTLLGEVKNLRGRHLVVRHLPEAPLALDDAAARSIDVFDAAILQLWRGDPDGHLIVMATFTTDENGAGRVHALTLAMTDHNWLPYRSAAGRELLHAATAAGRRFTAPPPCGLADPDAPALVFADTTVPTAAYLRPSGGKHIAPGQPKRIWTWPAGRSMPPLPPPTHPVRPDDQPRPERAAEPRRSTT